MFKLFCESLVLPVFAVLCYLVLSQATNIPFWDEWGMATVFDRYYAGTLTFSYFFLGQSEHVLAIPQLIILIMGLNTQWDLRPELAVNLAVGFAIYLVYRSALPKESATKTHSLVLLPVLAVLVFSFVQWHNWTWGWAMQTFICMLASLLCLAVLALQTLNLKNMIIATLCAVIANLSFAGGSVLWIIGVALLIIRRADKPSFYIIWALAGGLCLYLYYLIRPTDVALSNIDLLANLKYIIIYIGSPMILWSWGLDTAFYLGIFGMALPVIYLVFNRKPQGYALFFLSVMTLVLMVATLTSIGRPSYMFGESTASRYASTAIHYWIALTCLLTLAASRCHVIVKMPIYALLVSVTLLSAFISWQSIHYFYTKDERTVIITYLRYPYLVSIDRVNFKSIIWNRGELNRKTALMQKHRLSFYAPEKTQ